MEKYSVSVKLNHYVLYVFAIKVFIIYTIAMTGWYPCVKQALLDRGWHFNPDPTSLYFNLKWTLRSIDVCQVAKFIILIVLQWLCFHGSNYCTRNHFNRGSTRIITWRMSLLQRKLGWSRAYNLYRGSLMLMALISYLGNGHSSPKSSFLYDLNDLKLKPGGTTYQFRTRHKHS